MVALYTVTVGSKHSSKTDESTESSGDEHAGVVGQPRRHLRNGSIPLVTGAAVLLGAIRGRGTQKYTAVRLLASSGLIALGLRQRRQSGRSDAAGVSENHHHSGTGTSEQRAESHQEDVNPRGTASEPDIGQDTDSDDGQIQFTHDQDTETESVPAIDTESSGDPRVDDDDASTVDLSTASLADEASEAAGPSSTQSQPTQTDGLEPEETAEADTSHLATEDATTDEDWAENDESDDE